MQEEEQELQEESENTQSDADRMEAPNNVEKHSYKIWTVRVSKAQIIEKEDPPYHLNLYVFGLGKKTGFNKQVSRQVI